MDDVAEHDTFVAPVSHSARGGDRRRERTRRHRGIKPGKDVKVRDDAIDDAGGLDGEGLEVRLSRHARRRGVVASVYIEFLFLPSGGRPRQLDPDDLARPVRRDVGGWFDVSDAERRAVFRAWTDSRHLGSDFSERGWSGTVVTGAAPDLCPTR